MEGRPGDRAALSYCPIKVIVERMRTSLFVIALLLAACGEKRPPAPTAEENRQLDEAENMLNAEANETGPASGDTDPESNQQ